MSHNVHKMVAAALAALSVLLASPPGLAEPLVEVEGIVEVGTVDPWSTSEGGSGGSSSGSSSSGSTDTRTCIIPSPFGGCLLYLEEHEEFEDIESANETWYWYAAENSTMSGYYVDVLGGTVFTRASAGAVDEASGSGSEGARRSYERTLYETNLGYSEEHEDEETLAWNDTGSSASRAQRLLVEAGIRAPIAEGGLVVEREGNGDSSASRHSEGAGSNASSDDYFGIPLYGEEDEQEHFLHEESQAFWNQTRVGGTFYLVNPTDGSRVEIVGLTLDRGDEAGAGEGERSSSSRESTSLFGMTVFEHRASDSGWSEYAFFREWLRLEVDLVNGTVSGGVAYEHGDESSAGSNATSDETDALGIPVWGEAHEASEEAEREWRDVTFELDAGSGAGVLRLDAWDDSSRSHETYEDTYTIVGIPVGMGGERGSEFHSDGVGFGLDVGGGLLWIGARYENTTRSERSHDDVLLDHEPIAGIGSEESASSRGVFLDAGSSLVPVDASVRYENSSSASGDWIRFGGEDTFGVTSEDERTEYDADARAGDVFVFSFLYSDGRSDDAIHLAGVPLGVRDDYRRLALGASGDVVAPTGQHVFSYSFEHEESSDDYDLYADDTTIGGARHNATSDRLSIVVLDGAARAYVDREFSNTQVFAGDDTEIAELGLQQVDAGAEHGGVDEAGVEEGGADASVFLAYVEAADAIAIIVGLATWCVDPGVPVPYDTLLGALPDEARPIAATALQTGALLLCFGAPVLVPLFLASPCIVVPLALGTVFLTAGAATSLLPVGSDVAGMVLGTAEDAAWQAYNDVLGCVWLTIPDAARNPQPAIAALAAASEASEGALAQAWPVYDAARVTAWTVVDAAFGADDDVPMPGPLPPPPGPPGVPDLPPELPP